MVLLQAVGIVFLVTSNRDDAGACVNTHNSLWWYTLSQVGRCRSALQTRFADCSLSPPRVFVALQPSMLHKNGMFNCNNGVVCAHVHAGLCICLFQ
jgi:hypothetical protein